MTVETYKSSSGETIREPRGKSQNHTLNEIVVLVGIPGAGKSTLATARFSTHIRINLDTLKTLKRQDDALTKALENSENVVIDNTNVTNKSRRKWIEYAKKYCVPIIAIFIDTPLEIALERNRKREFPG